MNFPDKMLVKIILITEWVFLVKVSGDLIFNE